MMISLRRLRARRRRRQWVKNCLDRLSAATRNKDATRGAIEQKNSNPAGR
jgi:hypothetical protein